MLAPPPLPRTLEAARRDLTSAKPEIRRSAIMDLVPHALRDATVRTEAITVVSEILSEDAAPGVRAQAAIALADLAAVEVLPKLLVAVEDDAQEVRQMAISAIGEIGDARALPRLSRALTDERPEVRYQAFIAYVRVAPPHDMVEALARGLGDTDPAIRHIVLRLIEERLDAAPEGESNANASLALKSAGLLARVEGLLGDASADVSVAAAIVLTRLGSAAGAEVLKRVAAGALRPGKEEEAGALTALGDIGARDSIADLERRVWGLGRIFRDQGGFYARIALAKMGHPRAKDEIARDLNSPRSETRSRAVISVGHARLVEFRDQVISAQSIDEQVRKEALRDLDAAAQGTK